MRFCIRLFSLSPARPISLTAEPFRYSLPERHFRLFYCFNK
ncbi:Uncharacterized protein dnl_48540 [Desulfonema limicola]|uniref:Uncharacterized protein n=1 Tax=Desulfonema limicola TaxID=45656 RepID=A0A975BC14_9BACT|nr:Uncharacterized protein dnl_48540 [Desulfonema limicola]